MIDGFAVTPIVPDDTVTGADATVVGVMPAADLVTVATSDWPASAAGTTNEVLSFVPTTGDPLAVHRIVVDVGVGLQVPRSSVAVPPTVADPPITGVPTVVNGCGAAGGVKSTLTVAPAAPIEVTWTVSWPEALVQVPLEGTEVSPPASTTRSSTAPPGWAAWITTPGA